MRIHEIVFFGLSCMLEAIASAFVLSVSMRILNKQTFGKISRYIYISAIYIFFLDIANNLIQAFYPSLLWLKIILAFTVTSIILKFVYKSGIINCIFSNIYLSFLLTVAELIIVFVIQSLGLKTYDFATNQFLRFILSSLIQASIVVVSLIILKLYNIFSTNKINWCHITKYFLPQFITIAICMFPLMVILITKYYEFSSTFIIINFVQLVVVSGVGLYSIRNIVIQKNTECELANTIVHNKTLLKVNEGVRGFKHDMSNIIQAILGYTALNDLDGVKKYCQNLVVGFNDINILSILSPEVINEPAIYGVVVNKILIAREKNMNLTLDVNTNVLGINFPKFELSRILGILIDNSIEAGEKTEDKKLIVNLHYDCNKKCNVVIISNSIRDTNIDLIKIFDKNYSTKKNPSGFGLYEVAKFLDKYPQGHIIPTIDKENMLFTQKLVIKD